MPIENQLPANLDALLASLLSGQGDYFSNLSKSHESGSQILLLMELIVACTTFYGAVMGLPGGWKQSIASALKTPALLLGCLMICLPAFYVITTLAGSRTPAGAMIAMMLFALAVTSAILASLAPIAGFFAASGSQYDFMKILHVAAFAFGGAWGMHVLSAGIAQLAIQSDPNPAAGMTILRAWIALYAFVGAQMAWTLRPFIGAPGLPFEMIRKSAKGMNFYTAVAASFRKLNQPARKRQRKAKDSSSGIKNAAASSQN